MESLEWLFRAPDSGSSVTEFALLLVASDGQVNQPIGSAVFVAAELVMTSKRALDEAWRRMGPEAEFAGKDKESDRLGIMAVQYLGGGSAVALWRASAIVRSPHTDAAFLSVRPANAVAESYSFVRLPVLHVLPPVMGDRVTGFGYSWTEDASGSGELRGSAAKSRLHIPSGNAAMSRKTPGARTVSGTVTAVHAEYRDRAMFGFPCFEIDAYFGEGMSGGPLYNEAGQLCGLMCASQERQTLAHGATLWAAMATRIAHEGPGMVCKGSYPVFEMANVGFLHISAWRDIVPRIEVQRDSFGREQLRLKTFY